MRSVIIGDAFLSRFPFHFCEEKINDGDSPLFRSVMIKFAVFQPKHNVGLLNVKNECIINFFKLQDFKLQFS